MGWGRAVRAGLLLSRSACLATRLQEMSNSLGIMGSHDYFVMARVACAAGTAVGASAPAFRGSPDPFAFGQSDANHWPAG